MQLLLSLHLQLNPPLAITYIVQPVCKFPAWSAAGEMLSDAVDVWLGSNVLQKFSQLASFCLSPCSWWQSDLTCDTCNRLYSCVFFFSFCQTDFAEAVVALTGQVLFNIPAGGLRQLFGEVNCASAMSTSNTWTSSSSFSSFLISVMSHWLVQQLTQLASLVSSWR